MCIFDRLKQPNTNMHYLEQYKYLCTKEACQYLGITRGTLHNYVKLGKIKKYRDGNARPFYIREELDDWIKKSIKN